MTVSLFIKTWSGDFRWLYYCLESVKKFARNYHELVIVIPEHEQEIFFEKFKHGLPERTKVFPVKEEGHGYLFQQYIKLQAHKYCTGEYIKYLDSDCILNKPFDAHSLIYDGKPEILMKKYRDENGENQIGHAICWQYETQRVMGQRIEYEFMRRHILCYHRQTLIDFEEWCRFDLKELFLDRSFGDSISEFNLIGAFAFTFQGDMYKFVDVDKDWTWVDPQVIQYHTHGEEGDRQFGENKAFLDDLTKIRKVLIMVISCEHPPYDKMIETSLRTWDSSWVPGVDTIFYCGQSDKDDTETVIHVDVVESLFTMGKKDLLAYEWALNNKEFDYVARVNSSCYVDKQKLFDYVQGLPNNDVFEGVRAPSANGFEYLWGGAHYIISRDVLDKMVMNQEQWRHDLMEDEAMSVLVRDLGIPYRDGNATAIMQKGNGYLAIVYGKGTSMEFTDFNDLKKNKCQYFYRVKQDGKRDQDAAIMEQLYKTLNS